MKKTILLLVFIFSLSLSAQQKTRFDKIDSLLVYLNQNKKFMGQVCIRQAGNVVFEKAYGFANVENNLSANKNTKYKIGSITKTFTAVMIMQLIEEKKLKLDSKLSKFYPQIPNATKITIHDLLHHRTGILDFINGDSTVNVYQKVSKEEMIAKISGYKPVFEPNTKFEYSNSNYYILGKILEEVTKKEYATNLEERITNKLQLQNTSIATNTDPTKNESYSYNYTNEKWTINKEWDLLQAFGAGNIAATTGDLTLFLEAIFNGLLLKKTSVDEMIKLEQSYGKGLVAFPFGERKFYGHTGGIEGFRAVVGYYPTEKTGISLIVNGDNYNRNDIMMGILSIYYKMPYQFPNLTTFEVPKDKLASYQGIYASAQLPIKITIKIDKGELTAQGTGQNSFALNPISETEFVFDPAGIKLIFDTKSMTLKQGAGQYLFTKE
ncbi:beta-lactamase family protein [Flavobacterium psychrophilum]|nr:beta-lactamase family protein [Flavobacterium psychrophilum]EKT4517366.1 beta-lactamase family protein [Flavobacterium psychrophilum]